jgi:cytosine deaminase
LRTHIDSIPPQHAISWPVFAELRDAWAGRIELQGVNLIHLPLLADLDACREVADLVADMGGVLGAVAYVDEDAPVLIDRVFALAEERGLDLDFHVDEGLDAEARSLRLIAETARRRDFRGRVNCGHCCAITVQDDRYIEETLDIVAETTLSVVSLPMCNMYLQDRAPGRTPRRRAVTLLHEFKASRSRSPPTTRVTRSTGTATSTCTRCSPRRRGSPISTGRSVTGRAQRRRRQRS